MLIFVFYSKEKLNDEIEKLFMIRIDSHKVWKDS